MSPNLLGAGSAWPGFLRRTRVCVTSRSNKSPASHLRAAAGSPGCLSDLRAGDVGPKLGELTPDPEGAHLAPARELPFNDVSEPLDAIKVLNQEHRPWTVDYVGRWGLISRVWQVELCRQIHPMQVVTQFRNDYALPTPRFAEVLLPFLVVRAIRPPVVVDAVSMISKCGELVRKLAIRIEPLRRFAFKDRDPELNPHRAALIKDDAISGETLHQNAAAGNGDLLGEISIADDYCRGLYQNLRGSDSDSDQAIARTFRLGHGQASIRAPGARNPDSLKITL